MLWLALIGFSKANTGAIRHLSHPRFLLITFSVWLEILVAKGLHSHELFVEFRVLIFLGKLRGSIGLICSLLTTRIDHLGFIGLDSLTIGWFAAILLRVSVVWVGNHVLIWIAGKPRFFVTHRYVPDLSLHLDHPSIHLLAFFPSYWAVLLQNLSSSWLLFLGRFHPQIG